MIRFICHSDCTFSTMANDDDDEIKWNMNVGENAETWINNAIHIYAFEIQIITFIYNINL